MLPGGRSVPAAGGNLTIRRSTTSNASPNCGCARHSVAGSCPLTGSMKPGAMSASGFSTKACFSSGAGCAGGRAFHHQVAVEHHVDVQGPVGEARPAAVAAVRVFQRMQPVVQFLQRQVGLDRHRIVEEGRAIEADRGGTVGGRHLQRAEALAQAATAAWR
jgi:hypothetical protein